MCVCSGYSGEQCVCAVATVGNSGVCCGFCSEQCVCAVGTVVNGVCVLVVL